MESRPSHHQESKITQASVEGLSAEFASKCDISIPSLKRKRSQLPEDGEAQDTHKPWAYYRSYASRYPSPLTDIPRGHIPRALTTRPLKPLPKPHSETKSASSPRSRCSSAFSTSSSLSSPRSVTPIIPASVSSESLHSSEIMQSNFPSFQDIRTHIRTQSFGTLCLGGFDRYAGPLVGLNFLCRTPWLLPRSFTDDCLVITISTSQ